MKRSHDSNFFLVEAKWQKNTALFSFRCAIKGNKKLKLTQKQK